jgi:hypothetical protein
MAVAAEGRGDIKSTRLQAYGMKCQGIITLNRTLSVYFRYIERASVLYCTPFFVNSSHGEPSTLAQYQSLSVSAEINVLHVLVVDLAVRHVCKTKVVACSIVDWGSHSVQNEEHSRGYSQETIANCQLPIAKDSKEEAYMA